MSSPTLGNTSSTRRVIALTGVDTAQLANSPFDALGVSREQFILSEHNNLSVVQPLYRADSVCAAALSHEIRTRGTDGAALIFASSPVMQQAVCNMLSLFKLPPYSVITSVEQIAQAGRRNLILDLSARPGCVSQLGSRRVAGFVQSSETPGRQLLETVKHVKMFEHITALSPECTDPGANSEPIRLITAGGRLGHNHQSSLVLHGAHFQELADSYRNDILSKDIPPAGVPNSRIPIS